MAATITAETANRIRQRAHTIAAIEYDAQTARRFEQAVRDFYSVRETVPDLFAEQTHQWVNYLVRAAWDVLGLKRDYDVPDDGGPGTLGPNAGLVHDYVRAALDLYAGEPQTRG